MAEQFTVHETWQMIDFAIKHGCKVTNKDGHIVKPHKSDSGKEIKVYSSFPYFYYSTTDSPNEPVFYFDGKSYDDWYNEKVFELD